MKLWRIFVRNTEPAFFDAWEQEAPSIVELITSGAIRARIGDAQPYDELVVTEVRGF